MNGLMVLRNSVAATTLLAAGVGIGEADFKPTVSKLHELSESRPVLVGSVGCTRLDSIDTAIQSLQTPEQRTPGRLEAHAAPASEPWCWQVNGRQVLRTQAARCNTIDAIAAALVGARRTADSLDYVSAHWTADKLSDPATCWQTNAQMQIQMSCTPE